MSNLIGNALKYTPAEGRVRIEVAQRHEGQVEITVSDTGLGIPADSLPYIWDEFFRARNVREAGLTGAGLGLSIVRQLVEQSNSAPTDGSLATIERYELTGRQILVYVENLRSG